MSHSWLPLLISYTACGQAASSLCDVKHFLYTVPSPEYVLAYIGNYHLTLGLTLGLLTYLLLSTKLIMNERLYVLHVRLTYWVTSSNDMQVRILTQEPDMVFTFDIHEQKYVNVKLAWIFLGICLVGNAVLFPIFRFRPPK